MKLEKMLGKIKQSAKVLAIVGTIAASTALAGCKNPFTSDDCDLYDGGKPRIEFTDVPKVGSHDYVEGQVKNVNPDDYQVSLYIKVGSSWWMKPYWSDPLSGMDECGNFSIDYTTGGIDSRANTINAYLVTKDFKPQYHTLPSLSDPKVLAMTSAAR